MRAIKSKDTSIEVVLRKELWKRGLRYRKNCKDLPGRPDIVFKRHKVAVFCDSEFWHGRNWEEKKEKIRANREYWITKIECNIKRDVAVNKALEGLGYAVMRFWGDEILKDVSTCANRIEWLINDRTRK